MVGALVLAATLQAVTLAGRLQSGVTVAPDTVRVGDPFTVSIRVRAPQGSVIEFPPAPDSGGAAEPLDPVRIVATADSVAVDQTAEYRLAAWRPGGQPIAFTDVLVRQEIGVRRVPVTGVQVFVASVLPPDTSLHEPRPARAPFYFGLPWWVWGLAALAAAAFLALVTWLLLRRRTRPPAAIPPITVAEREFDRIEGLALIGAGERSRHVDLMVEVLRDYLAASVPGATTSLTSSELAGTLRRARLSPHVRCATLLAEADLVKFAARAIPEARAVALGREARAVATAVDAALSTPAGKRAA